MDTIPIRLAVPRHYQRRPVSIGRAMLPDKRIEITIVWAGESLRYRISSLVYALFRLILYGRLEDIETIYLLPGHRVNMNGTLNHPDITSFDDTSAGHYTTTYSTESSEILLYVNTWNHLMSPRPLPFLNYVQIPEPPQINETCAETERRLSIPWPWKQNVSSSGKKAPSIILPS